MKIGLDSNVLLYLARVWRSEDDKDKTAKVETLLPKLDNATTVVLPVQVLGEAYSVMQRFGHSRETSRATILDWAVNFDIVGSGEASFIGALDLATDHKLQLWDALILNVAADAGCSLLLSEDMQDGFAWHGVTVVNPFAEKMHKRLARVLEA